MASSLKTSLYRALWSPALKPALQRIPYVRRIYAGWSRRHPFDLSNGVDTSGYLAPEQCAEGTALAASISPYGGSQPSIVRAALATMGDVREYSFVDIGCGKGRPLIVAGELPFRRVVGVELSAPLVEVARTNARVIAQRFPERAAIEVECADATAFAVGEAKVVFFMYHAFDRSLVAQLVANIERQLGAGLEHAYFIYYNPVHGDVLDASPKFARWSAQARPYAADELGYGPDLADTVVIWQSRPERVPPRPGADRALRVDAAEWTSLG